MELKYMPYVTHFPKDGSHMPFCTVMWVAASPMKRWGQFFQPLTRGLTLWLALNNRVCGRSCIMWILEARPEEAYIFCFCPLGILPFTVLFAIVRCPPRRWMMTGEAQLQWHQNSEHVSEAIGTAKHLPAIIWTPSQEGLQVRPADRHRIIRDNKL